MQLTVTHQFLPKSNSTRAAMVMDHFGIDFEQGEHVVARDFDLPIEPGQVVLLTGESGSGKSSLMRAVAEQLKQADMSVVNLDDLSWEENILVDLLPLELEESLSLLARCGLAEAHLMLRTPAELSDGQRYRFRLALALAQKPQWIVADEFTATLDRRLAKVVAFNLQRLSKRTGTGFLLATTHEDVAEDLAAGLQVHCRLDGHIQVRSAVENNEMEAGSGDRHLPEDSSLTSKKKCHPSPATCGSPGRPNPTGRTSLGGITGAITLD